MFCKNSTNLSFVEPPFSYNIHPKHFLLDIADNNVNFLNTSLLFTLIPLHNNDKCIDYYNLIFSEYLKETY